jgi:hypothetical protein
MNHLKKSFLPGLARIFALEQDISAEWSKDSLRGMYDLDGGLSIIKGRNQSSIMIHDYN